MDKNFWLERWKNNEIAFHLHDANPLIVKYFKELWLEKGDRVFVPLCGKTLDIGWLLYQGYRVVGAELAESAIVQLFADLKVTPQISQKGKHKHYAAENIDIYVGDIFELSADQLGVVGVVDAVYDRAALVALPEEMRHVYVEHLMDITDQAPQLLITYEYDQSKIPGPPFSISGDELAQHCHKNNYHRELIESVNVPEGLKGFPAKENVWVLE